MNNTQPNVEHTLHENNTHFAYQMQSMGEYIPTDLKGIHHQHTNIAVWKRELDDALKTVANDIIKASPNLNIALITTSGNAYSDVKNSIDDLQNIDVFCEDIALLVNMFCCLFNQTHIGLRLTAIDQAMCPRFHVDHVPCRLITTYYGIATQWLPNDTVDREKLGIGSAGKMDHESGVYTNSSDIRQLDQGHVALLKGEKWPKNKGAGLVHRSPPLKKNTHRLLLTLDFTSE